MTTNQAPRDNPTPALVGRLRAGVAALDELRSDVEARAPWPLSDNFGTEPEAYRGPPELLAHVEEMLRYWLGEIERVIARGPDGGRVAFGRRDTDSLRLALIERDRTLPLSETYSRIHAEADRIADRLVRTTPDEAASPGLHPRYGLTTAAAVADRHIVDHLERHVAQLREILATDGQRPQADDPGM